MQRKLREGETPEVFPYRPEQRLVPRIEANAFVVLEAGATATETELRNYARDHLAHFKCPQRIQFVPELPKTATGKVQKYILRGKQPAISKQ